MAEPMDNHRFQSSACVGSALLSEPPGMRAPRTIKLTAGKTGIHECITNETTLVSPTTPSSLFLRCSRTDPRCLDAKMCHGLTIGHKHLWPADTLGQTIK